MRSIDLMKKFHATNNIKIYYISLKIPWGFSRCKSKYKQTNKQTKKPPVSSSLFLLQDEREASQCKRGKCWPTVLSIAFV